MANLGIKELAVNEINLTYLLKNRLIGLPSGSINVTYKEYNLILLKKTDKFELRLKCAFVSTTSLIWNHFITPWQLVQSIWFGKFQFRIVNFIKTRIF